MRILLDWKIIDQPCQAINAKCGRKKVVVDLKALRRSTRIRKKKQ